MSCSEVCLTARFGETGGLRRVSPDYFNGWLGHGTGAFITDLKRKVRAVAVASALFLPFSTPLNILLFFSYFSSNFYFYLALSTGDLDAFCFPAFFEMFQRKIFICGGHHSPISFSLNFHLSSFIALIRLFQSHSIIPQVPEHKIPLQYSFQYLRIPPSGCTFHC